jgi:TolB-like protein
MPCLPEGGAWTGLARLTAFCSRASASISGAAVSFVSIRGVCRRRSHSARAPSICSACWSSGKGELVSKDEIMEAVWAGRVVEEANLNVQISKLRHILDVDREQGSCIQTIPGRGYCFVAPVRQPGVEAQSALPLAALAALPGSHASLPLPDQPSIAVLPFANLSSDHEQEYFSDGIVEDIITALSRYPSLFVIARNSCFTYKGRAVDVKQVGRELGVRYLLEGGLRKAGNRIRVTAQLVEAETGNHLWAERYDRDLADIFAVQDEITQVVTISVAPAIADAELRRAMRKPPQSLDAWAAYQRGLWHLSKATRNDNSLAEKSFQQAIDFDPNFSGGYRGLAFTQNQTRDFRGRGLLEGLNAIEALARRAVALDPANAEARSCLGMALYKRADYEGALAEIEYALVTSPNLAIAHGVFGAILAFSGAPKARHRGSRKKHQARSARPTISGPFEPDSAGALFLAGIR